MSTRFRQWIGFLIMLIGLGLLASPFLVGAFWERAQQTVVENFHRQEQLQQTTEPVMPTRTAPTTQPMETTQPAATTEPEETTHSTVVTEPEETTQPTVVTEPEETTQPTAHTEPAATVSTGEPAAPPESSAPIQEEAAPVSDQNQAFYQAAVEYNGELVHGGQGAMNSIGDLEYFPIDARQYGYSDNVVGTIRIPRLGVELGLYLGASGDNMAKGAALFGLTSIPLGQPDENAAIAGHRGWSGTAMFRDIQMLQMEDPIYVTTPWAELEYRVCGIEIVTPENITWCKIHPGRTLITLMTCHPYGHHDYRYIVYAELVPEEPEGELPTPEEANEPPTMEPEAASGQTAGEEITAMVTFPSQEAAASLPGLTMPETTQTSPAAEPEQASSVNVVTVVHADGTRETAVLDASAIIPDGREYGAVMSNVVILAENKMRPIAWAMAVLVALVGIWLTIQTIGDRRKEKGGNTHASK